MNIDRESVIRMAREAGWTIGPATINGLERFAALVAAAAIKQERKEFAIHVVDIARRAVAEEREACAKVCDHAEKNWRKSWHSGAEKIAADAVSHCATAIRARGNT